MPYSSHLANLVLYTPFDSKATIDAEISKKLSPSEFLNECYVLPQFELNSQLSITDSDHEAMYDYTEDTQKLIDIHAQQKKSYDNFLKWISDQNNTKIYTISGNAGTGKTTFIHYQKHLQNNKFWVVLDLSKANSFIHWSFNNTTEIENFSNAYGKMIAIVLSYLKTCFFGDDISDINNAVSSIIDLLDDYKIKISNKNISGQDFFKRLVSVRRPLFLNNHNKEKYLNVITAEITSYFNNVQKNKSLVSFFRIVLDILIITISCKNRHNKDSIIVFDNIERFIGHDEIYNKDVDLIRKELSSYSREIVNSTMKGNFKFILSLRSSTRRMCGVKLQSADELPSDLDLTQWFFMDDIIDRKVKWYRKQSIEIDSIDIATQIISDLRKCTSNELTGLQLFINPLFNNNLRLITEFVGILVEKPSNYKFVKKYQELWNENTPVSRFAARSLIRSLIYSELDTNDNLFHNLQLSSEIEIKQIDKKDDDYGMSYTRKILTILYNSVGDISLEQVIAKLCKIKIEVKDYWNEKIDDNSKQKISEVLFYMNSYNRRTNDWIQFIDMQISGMEKSAVIENPEMLKEIINSNLDKITLRIMPAGKAFIRYMVASFEYFSYRFYKNHNENFIPVFSIVPTEEELINCKDINNLDCVKIFKYVEYNANKCCENIDKRGDILLSLSPNQTQQSHKARIVKQHQGFIDNFILYLEEKYCEKTKNLSVFKQFKNELLKIRDDYKQF